MRIRKVNIGGEEIQCDCGSYHVKIGKYVYARQGYAFVKGLVDDDNHCRLNMRVTDDEIKTYLKRVGQSLNDKLTTCPICSSIIVTRLEKCDNCGCGCDESPSSYRIRLRLTELNNKEDIFE